MNKLMKLSMVAALTLGLVACAKTEGSEEKGIKIGMVTDSGTIDDKSFNQGTWEGVLEYKEDNPSAEVQYLMPTGETTQDYLEAIDNLAMTGVEVMVLPGFKFEEALGVAQEKYPEIKFVASAQRSNAKSKRGSELLSVADATRLRKRNAARRHEHILSPHGEAACRHDEAVLHGLYACHWTVRE